MHLSENLIIQQMQASKRLDESNWTRAVYRRPIYRLYSSNDFTVCDLMTLYNVSWK